MDRLDWKSDAQLEVDGTRFMVNPMELGRQDDPDAQVIYKPRWMVDRYTDLDVDAQNVFELGIHEGGSTALLALLFRPRRLVAVDLTAERAPRLDNFIDSRDLHQTLHAHYGIDQSDRRRLEALVEEEFGDEPLDLVIDDASHLLAETTASFNVLFPRLRPGGVFVLEDWSYWHEVEAVLTERIRADQSLGVALQERVDSGDAVPTNDGISRLVCELVLTTAYASGIVARVDVERAVVVVRRGDAVLDPAGFDISECYGSFGRSMLI